MPGEEGTVNAKKAREIVDAAYLILLEDGFSGASIRKIANRAGTSKYMIHYYFEDKETLLIEVVKKVVREISIGIADIFRRYPSNEERIEKGIRDFWEGFKKDPGHLAILQESAIYGRRIPEINERIMGFYRGVVEQLAEDIAADPSNKRKLAKKEAESLVIHLFATLDGLAIQYMRDPQLVDYDYNLELLIRSLKSFIS
ncbi:MAG: TetR/AcrR family transcriptional regulator [Actinobacteria bacterium]|jgi:AcrR family transcriptional regulator|nr:MAG: TetR/AcrR family transcriptional regulator [Actinomycetota bacterium]